jgi:hypothetical protein
MPILTQSLYLESHTNFESTDERNTESSQFVELSSDDVSEYEYEETDNNYNQSHSSEMG